MDSHNYLKVQPRATPAVSRLVRNTSAGALPPRPHPGYDRVVLGAGEGGPIVVMQFYDFQMT